MLLFFNMQFAIERKRDLLKIEVDESQVSISTG